MKITQFLSGFLCAGLLFMMISATKDTEQADVGNYHISTIAAQTNLQYILYNSVNGEYVTTNKSIGKHGNIKEFIEQHRND
jgi:predicted peroxiredoxin